MKKSVLDKACYAWLRKEAKDVTEVSILSLIPLYGYNVNVE